MPRDRALRIVVTGEALIDLVLARDGGLGGHPGGGPYNVARTVGRLEQPVTYLGRVSTDGFGRRLRAELEADGVSLDGVVATDAPTTLALAELDDAGVATYRFYAAATSAPGLTAQDARAALPDGSGSSTSARSGSCSSRWPRRSRRSSAGWATTRSSRWTRTAGPAPSTTRPPTGAGWAAARPRGRVKASEEDLEWLDPGTGPADGGAGAARRTAARWRWSPWAATARSS